MSPALVSVIMAVRNGERFIADAIRSVLAQRWRPMEIVVVDGHSTDATVTIARSFPDARVVSQTGVGIADAYNVGIQAARGDFIAFLSHDDLWVPGKLETQLGMLLDRPELAFVVGLAKFFLEPGSSPPAGFRRELLAGEHVAYIMEVLCARRSVFDVVGRFDTSLSTGEDVDWFARARDLGVVHAVVPGVLVYKRVHESNSSLNDPATNQILLSVLRRSLERKRSRMAQGPP